MYAIRIWSFVVPIPKALQYATRHPVLSAGCSVLVGTPQKPWTPKGSPSRPSSHPAIQPADMSALIMAQGDLR